MGIEVTVIDGSDHVGWMAGASRTGELYMTSVASMVRVVLAHIASRRMDRLNILDHGSTRSIQIGTDRVSVTTLPRFEGQLRRLRGHFSRNGFVHLQHCNAGGNAALLLRLAQVFGVSVYAGTGLHHAVYRFNTGDYVRADPNGSFARSVPRP